MRRWAEEGLGVEGREPGPGLPRKVGVDGRDDEVVSSTLNLTFYTVTNTPEINEDTCPPSVVRQSVH